MNKLEFVKEIPSSVNGGSQALFKSENNFYVVSSIPFAPDHKMPETLIFACDEDGEITDWADLAGGPNMSREEALAEFEKNGPVKYSFLDKSPTGITGVFEVLLDPPGEDYYVKE